MHSLYACTLPVGCVSVHLTAQTLLKQLISFEVLLVCIFSIDLIPVENAEWRNNPFSLWCCLGWNDVYRSDGTKRSLLLNTVAAMTLRKISVRTIKPTTHQLYEVRCLTHVNKSMFCWCFLPPHLTFLWCSQLSGLHGICINRAATEHNFSSLEFSEDVLQVYK